MAWVEPVRYDEGWLRCGYPLMLDVSRRLVVIVGGGGVAARKVGGLLDAGATRIRCVATEFTAGFPQDVAVERITASYDPKHLEGAGLVFAATDDAEVNSAVVRDGHRLGLLVSRADADDESPGDFSTPAVIRRGELVITVSAGGSPALSAAVRDGLRGRLDAKWEKMARAMRELRPRITGRDDLPIAHRRDTLRALASEEAMEILDRQGVDALWAWLKGNREL